MDGQILEALKALQAQTKAIWDFLSTETDEDESDSVPEAVPKECSVAPNKNDASCSKHESASQAPALLGSGPRGGWSGNVHKLHPARQLPVRPRGVSGDSPATGLGSVDKSLPKSSS